MRRIGAAVGPCGAEEWCPSVPANRTRMRIRIDCRRREAKARLPGAREIPACRRKLIRGGQLTCAPANAIRGGTQGASKAHARGAAKRTPYAPGHSHRMSGRSDAATATAVRVSESAGGWRERERPGD